jgi:integrase
MIRPGRNKRPAKPRRSPSYAIYLGASEAGRVLTRRKVAKKASTLATDKGRVARHIKPLLGHLKVASITRADIERFRDAVAEGVTRARIKTGNHGLARVTGGRGTATRTLALLGSIFTYAIKRGFRADNPAHGVERHAYGPRNRRLSEAEYGALGEALRAMPKTTLRRGEMLALRWSEVDLATRTARLSDTKTGFSLRSLSHAACDVLRTLPRLGDLVFPASVGADKPMVGFHKIWLRIAAKADPPKDITPHVLRHSFASIAADLGFSELTIAALLGHRKASVTKYAHHADAVLLQAADVVVGRVAELMGEGKTGTVVELWPSLEGRESR